MEHLIKPNKIIMIALSLIGFCKADLKNPAFLDLYKLSTVYISGQDTIPGMTFTGTGFMVWNYKDSTNFHLVTNRHVVRHKRFIDIRMPAVLSLKSGEKSSTVVQRVYLCDSGKTKNWFALQDTAIDIAVVNIDVNAFTYASPQKPIIYYTDVSSLRKETFADTDEIEEGEFVYFTGYPLGYVGKESPYPIVRFGIIASTHGKELIGNDVYLIDGSGFPGSSGSPVFLGKIRTTSGAAIGFGIPKLIGLQASYEPNDPIVDSTAEIKQSPDARPDTVEIKLNTKENTHLMVVLPGHLIKKTLALIDPEWGK